MRTPVMVSFFAALATICQMALGQNVVTRFPISVSVGAGGIATIHFREVAPMTIDQAIGQLPDHIPLGEVQPDGTVRPGILIQNDTTRVMTTISKARPVGVVLQPTGEWTIRDGSAGYDDTHFAPGHSEIIPGSEVIELCRTVSLGSEFARPIHEGFRPRSPEISWTYNAANQPASVSFDKVERQIAFASNLWQQLLAESTFQANFDVDWRIPNDPNTLAETVSPVRNDYSWPTVFEALLTNQFFNESSDIIESTLYDALPNSGSVPYHYSGGNSAAPRIVFTPALESQVFSFANSRSSIIHLNPNISFDDDPGTSGTDITTGKHDLFGVLVHEMGHGLGFTSQVGLANPQNPSSNLISAWDVFRLPLEFSSRRITDVEFQTRECQLSPNLLATLVSALDLSLSYTVEEASAHWLAVEGRVGIMDTSLPAGVSGARNGTFLQRADARAFDVIGYSLTPESVLPSAPGVSGLTGPTRIASSNPIELSWTAGGYVQSFDVFVKDSAGIVIFRQNDLVDASVTIPANSLSPGMTYSWVVLAYNWNGFFRSEAATFNTAGLCDPDINQDGNVDQNDIDYLIDVIAGGPNPTGADPDFNQDGNVDQNDVDALINVVAGGDCP